VGRGLKHLAGLMRSLHQAWSGRKAPFGRTPKAADRTPVPCAYVVAEFVVLMLWGVVALNIFLDDHPLAALLVLVHAGFLAYALGAFVGWRASAGDVLHAVRHRRHVPVPGEAWPLSAVASAPATPQPRRLPVTSHSSGSTQRCGPVACRRFCRKFSRVTDVR